MPEGLELVFRWVVIGVGATALSDLWTAFAKRALALPPQDWALVGRWIGNFPQGRFAHASIAQAPRVQGERAIGWAAHYAIGVLFAVILVMIAGPEWTRDPTPIPALAVGLLSVAAPFLIMQPAMGAGIAASRTPHPNAARLRSLVFHGVFGIGLYASALLSTLLF